MLCTFFMLGQQRQTPHSQLNYIRYTHRGVSTYWVVLVVVVGRKATESEEEFYVTSCRHSLNRLAALGAPIVGNRKLTPGDVFIAALGFGIKSWDLLYYPVKFGVQNRPNIYYIKIKSNTVFVIIITKRGKL